MSHTSIASTRDYNHGHDKGDLINPAQSASFTTDPLLTPIRTSQMPHPIMPDPTPSENPELFDKSTSHPNTHYHPEAKLSKKKRAKKLGTGYVAKPHGGAHGTGGVHAGGRTFSEHEKEAHERAERRDAAIAGEEEEGEWETDDEDESQQEQQSQTQHHEGRITGTEQGEKKPTAKRNDDASDKGSKEDDSEGREGGDDKQKDDKADNPSLMQRASNVLSTAQQRASDVASGVTSSVMSTAQSVPVVGTLLSKMGLGGAKSDDKSADKSDDGSAGADEEQEAEGGEEQSGKQSAVGGKGGEANKKVGGQNEKDVEQFTKGAGAQSTTESATKSSKGEMYGKEGARQDNNEGALDKSRSHAGQKSADNMRAVNQQAKKEEEA